MRIIWVAGLALGLLGAVHPLRGQEATRQPGRFAIIYNRGYGGDHLPRDPEAFEKLVVTLKEAHFNVLLGTHDAPRAAICKKHGVQLFVDLLAEPHHVYKNPEACRKLLTGLRGDPTVYGYHLWSDNIGKTYAGRSRDVKNVQEWDGTHPAYVGSYRMSQLSKVEKMDLFGYYDFHWKRGGHWSHLAQASTLARARGVPFLRYDAADPGVVGKGNPNRAGYTIATSIPFGLRGYTYHHAGGVVDPASGELDALGKDLKLVNGKLAGVGEELMRLGPPSAVYSTRVTADAKDRPRDDAGIPGGLTPIPEKGWFQVTAGEVVVGVCQDRERRDVLVLANHNPYRDQAVTLSVPGEKGVEVFDRASRRWKPVPAGGARVAFTVEDHGVALVRTGPRGG